MKRIIICCDGTWNSPDDEQATNVLRLSRAIAPVDAAGTKQVTFYDWGVGSDRKKLSGGITGNGIDKNILDCYNFIVHNYSPGDELYFFGFSRGAYTVRSLGGFIRNCGIYQRQHADRISAAYDHYRRRQPSTGPNHASSIDLRAKYAWSDRSEIEYLGVWDTVGSHGIAGVLGQLGGAMSRARFHDRVLSMDVVTLRTGSTLGPNSVILPAATLGRHRSFPPSSTTTYWVCRGSAAA